MIATVRDLRGDVIGRICHGYGEFQVRENQSCSSGGTRLLVPCQDRQTAHGTASRSRDVEPECGLTPPWAAGLAWGPSEKSSWPRSREQ